MQTYTLRSVTESLGISRGVVASLVELGYVKPARGPRSQLLFSFQDLVVLRTAFDLQKANVPVRRIVRSLRQLRETLPADVPLSGLRISVEGDEVVARVGSAAWRADTGQLLIDFEVRPASPTGDVVLFRSKSDSAAPAKSADSAAEVPADSQGEAREWFAQAVQFEAAGALFAAEGAYRQAIDDAPAWEPPYLNLGSLLLERGRTLDALDLFEHGISFCPSCADLRFNRALVLEDLGRQEEAIQEYGVCLRLQPEHGDAHHNLAQLHRARGETMLANRHENARRRIEQGR